jgi:hypothetical protein
VHSIELDATKSIIADRCPVPSGSTRPHHRQFVSDSELYDGYRSDYQHVAARTIAPAAAAAAAGGRLSNARLRSIVDTWRHNATVVDIKVSR